MSVLHLFPGIKHHTRSHVRVGRSTIEDLPPHALRTYISARSFLIRGRVLRGTTLEAIARRAGQSERTAIRNMQKCAARGWVSVDQHREGGHTHNTYTFHDDPSEPFAMVPAGMVQDMVTLRPRTMQVMLALLSMARPDQMSVWPKHRALADAAGMREAEIRRSLGELEAKGMLVKEGTGVTRRGDTHALLNSAPVSPGKTAEEQRTGVTHIYGRPKEAYKQGVEDQEHPRLRRGMGRAKGEDEIPAVGGGLFAVDDSPPPGWSPETQSRRPRTRTNPGASDRPYAMALSYKERMREGFPGIVVSDADLRQVAAYLGNLMAKHGWTPDQCRMLLDTYFKQVLSSDLAVHESHVTFFRRRAKALQGSVMNRDPEEEARRARERAAEDARIMAEEAPRLARMSREEIEEEGNRKWREQMERLEREQVRPWERGRG